MALSTPDTNKWLLLIEYRLKGQKLDNSTAFDFQLLGSVRQQRWLTEAQVSKMVTRYQEGATVYELAAEFDCHRTTVAARLKKAGIAMRGQSPTFETIDLMVCLHESGLSPMEVGKRLGFCANTVRNCLLERRIQAHDTHGRNR